MNANRQLKSNKNIQDEIQKQLARKIRVTVVFSPKSFIILGNIYNKDVGRFEAHICWNCSHLYFTCM